MIQTTMFIAITISIEASMSTSILLSIISVRLQSYSQPASPIRTLDIRRRL